MGEVQPLIRDCSSRKGCWLIGWLEFIIDVSIYPNIKTEYKESETILIGQECRWINWMRAYNSFCWAGWKLV